ncbi:MAG: winged helix-turn-helix domain-containing protein [Cohaesibacteraceae bacterium]
MSQHILLPANTDPQRRANSRRVGPVAQDLGRMFMINSWRIDVASRSVTDGDTVSRLSPRAVTLMQALASRPGEAISRAELMDAIWPDVVVGDESLSQTVTEARRILRDSRGPDQIIETIPKYGYRLVARVASGPMAQDIRPPRATDCFSLKSYELCMDARNALIHGGDDVVCLPEILTAEAVAYAPNYAFAHAEYAIALCFRWLYQRNDARGLERAFLEAEEAIRLRPDLAAGYAGLAFAHGAYGNVNEMRAALERGLALDAQDDDLRMVGARALFVAREYRSATALAERAAILNKDDFRSLFFGARAAMFFDPARGRRNAQACLARIQARLAFDPTEPRAQHTLGPVLSLLGRHEEALEAVEAQGPARSPCRFYAAIAYSSAGDIDRAVSVFEDIVDLGWRHLDWVTTEPSFQPAMDDRRFRKSLTRIKAE